MSQSVSTQSLTYVLYVLTTELVDPPEQTAKLYVEVTFPDGRRPRKTPKAEYSLPRWNSQFEFEASPTSYLAIAVRRSRKPPWKLSSLGEAKINVRDLLSFCQDSQDHMLHIYGKDTSKKTGSVSVRLELKANLPPSVVDTRGDVTSLQVALQSASLGKEPRIVQVAETTQGVLKETGGFSELESLCMRLEKLDSEWIKPFIETMDELSQVHYYAQAAWNIVRSVYTLYEKKKAMDNGIVELVQTMNDVLSFVEDADTLRNKLTSLAETVQKILVAIQECSISIYEYLNSNKAGQTWKAFSKAKQFSDYQSRFSKLSSMMNSAAILHMAHNTEESLTGLQTQNNLIISRLDSSASSPPSRKTSKVVDLPTPTEIFSGRPNDLKAIATAFELPKTSIELGRRRIFVLHGTGGTGKTQLGLKFFHENANSFSTIHRYMIDASSNESIEESFVSIGSGAGIEGDSKAVIRWLSRIKEDWILLFDNADDPNVPLTSFFPDTLYGNILITTRNNDYRTLAPKCSLEVSTLEEATAIQLLLQASLTEPTEQSEAAARAIVNDFGCLALAVVQAGSYIATRHLSLQEYRSLYESDRVDLLSKALGPDVPYPQPVFMTWEISYAALSDPAATFLNVCSFLYREGLAEGIFCSFVTSQKASRVLQRSQDPGQQNSDMPSTSLVQLIRHLRKGDNQWNKSAFVDLIHELRSYSLVSEQLKGVYGIHPLVHEWARDRMAQQDSFQLDAQYILYYAIPPCDDSTHITISRMLLPHLSPCGQPKDVKISRAFADVYMVCGRWEDEESIRKRVLEETTSLLGKDHPDVLTDMSDLASTYFRKVRLNDAEELHAEVLEARKRILGADHPDTLTSMNELASVYRKHDRVNDAEKLFLEVLEARQRILGVDHLDTLTSMHELASTYRAQYRANDAEKLDVKVIEARKRVLGVNHPNTLYSMANLAVTYTSQERYDEAENLYKEVLEARKLMLGDEHPSTLKTMSNVAALYSKQGRYSDAVDLGNQVVELSKRLLGDEHRSTIRAMAHLTMAYQGSQEYRLAEQWGEHSLNLSTRVLGVDHRETLQSMVDLASTYVLQNRLVEAEGLQIEAVNANKRIIGVDHFSTLWSMSELANTYLLQKRWVNSEGLLAEVIEGYKRTQILDGERSLTDLSRLAIVYREQGRLREAIEMQILAVEGTERVLGPQNPVTLRRMKRLDKMRNKELKKQEVSGVASFPPLITN